MSSSIAAGANTLAAFNSSDSSMATAWIARAPKSMPTNIGTDTIVSLENER